MKIDDFWISSIFPKKFDRRLSKNTTPRQEVMGSFCNKEGDVQGSPYYSVCTLHKERSGIDSESRQNLLNNEYMMRSDLVMKLEGGVFLTKNRGCAFY